MKWIMDDNFNHVHSKKIKDNLWLVLEHYWHRSEVSLVDDKATLAILPLDNTEDISVLGARRKATEAYKRLEKSIVMSHNIIRENTDAR